MRAALLALIVFVALVLGSIAGPGAFGDPQEKIDRKLDELDRIQSSTGSLREQIDAMNARVDDLIGRESVLRQQESALGGHRRRPPSRVTSLDLPQLAR